MKKEKCVLCHKEVVYVIDDLVENQYPEPTECAHRYTLHDGNEYSFNFIKDNVTYYIMGNETGISISNLSKDSGGSIDCEFNIKEEDITEKILNKIIENLVFI